METELDELRGRVRTLEDKEEIRNLIQRGTQLIGIDPVIHLGKRLNLGHADFSAGCPGSQRIGLEERRLSANTAGEHSAIDQVCCIRFALDDLADEICGGVYPGRHPPRPRRKAESPLRR